MRMSTEIENSKKHALANNSEEDDSNESWAGPKLSEINANPDDKHEEPEPAPKRRKSLIQIVQDHTLKSSSLILIAFHKRDTIL